MMHLACLTAGDCCSKAGCLAVAGAPRGAVNLALPPGLIPGGVPFSSPRSSDCWADWSYETAFTQAARRSGVSCKRIPLWA